MAVFFGLGRGLVDYGDIDPFDVGHRGGVALARPELDDTGVAAGAGGAARADLREQLADGLDRAGAVVVELGQGGAPGVEPAALGEGDQFFGNGTHGLGFGQSRFDAPMLDEADGLVGEQRVAVLGRTAQFNGFVAVTHG